MSRSIFYSLDDEFQFGKHQGTSLRDVLVNYPEYLIWCLENLSYLRLSSALVEEIQESYPDFPGNDLLDEHELYEPDDDEEEDDEYEDPGYEYYEKKHYRDFAGTYVQDVVGWSDEMIYDALDGDPDAYWNID